MSLIKAHFPMDVSTALRANLGTEWTNAAMAQKHNITGFCDP